MEWPAVSLAAGALPERGRDSAPNQIRFSTGDAGGRGCAPGPRRAIALIGKKEGGPSGGSLGRRATSRPALCLVLWLRWSTPALLTRTETGAAGRASRRPPVLGMLRVVSGCSPSQRHESTGVAGTSSDLSMASAMIESRIKFPVRCWFFFFFWFF